MPKTKNTSVSVIIPSYNGGDLLMSCLGSVPAGRTEIIVVDNGSRDGSVQAAKSKFPKAKYLLLGKNLGFAAACNRGARAASGKVLLFLNQDAEIVEDGYGKTLELLLADKKRGIASARILYPDGKLQETVRGFPGYVSFAFGRKSLLARLFPRNPFSRHYLCTDMDWSKTQAVQSCTGMFMMIRRELFEKLGGFDEGFFFYVEDIDLCRRATDAGYQVWYLGQTGAIHHIGENVAGSSRVYVKMHHYKGIYRYLVKHKRPGWMLKGLIWLITGLAIVAHLAVKRR